MHELLQETWDTYAQLVRRKSDRHSKRHAVLEKFLKLYLILADGSDGGPNLGNIKNLCSQLCQELMNDILIVSNNTHDESDASGLEQYLLQGRGWMLLKVIHHVGVKRLSNCRDLCNLLLSLMPWCHQFQSVEGGKMLAYHDLTREPVSNCFKMILKLSKLKMFGCSDDRRHMDCDLYEDHTTDRKKILKHVSSNVGNLSDSDDNAVNPKPKHRHLRVKRGRVNAFKHSTLPDDNESDSDQDLKESLPNVSVESITSADLCHVIFSLLQDLCVLDLDHVAPGKFMSSVILPHLLHFLSSLSNGKDGVEKLPWSKEIVLCLQKQLVCLVLTVGAIIATQQNGVKILLSHNIVTALLRTVSQFLEPSQAEGAKKESMNYEKVTDVERHFIHDTLCGVILLLEVIFQQLPFNPSFINNALCIVDEFKENRGFLFIKILLTELQCVSSHTGPFGDATNEELLKYISSLIHTLKLVKINYIHALKCLKRRHRNCDYKQYLHHHHDILGLSVTSSIQQRVGRTEKHSLYTHSKCLVAEWMRFVLELLAGTGCKKLQVQLLSMLHSPGICCCMHPKMWIETLMPIIPRLSIPIAGFCLEMLNEVLLEQFLGKDELDSSSGSVCQHCSLESDFTVFSKLSHAESLHDLAKGRDSGFSSVDMLDQRKQKSLKRWQVLQLLKSHMVSSNEDLALVTAKHLMILAIRGNSDIKEQLFFRIYQQILHWPVDESLSSLTDTSSDEQLGNVSIPSSVLMYCVSALPYVLQVDIVMNAFLEKHGLARLAELMEDEHLRAPVMGVFEALIMIDEQKVQEQKRKQEPEMSKFTSDYVRGTVMQMFIDSLAQKTCTITADFKKLTICSQKDGKTLVMVDSNERQTNCQTDLDEKQIRNKRDLDEKQTNGQTDLNKKLRDVKSDLDEKPTHSKTYLDEKQVEDNKTDQDKAQAGDQTKRCIFQNHHSIVKSLPILLDMWKTCAKLCMNSPTFRSYYQNSPCLYIVQDTLLLVLEILTGMSKLPAVACCERSLSKEKSFSCHLQQLAFIEAVMVVCFSCSTISSTQKSFPSWGGCPALSDTVPRRGVLEHLFSDKGSEEEHWSELLASLRRCVNLEPSKLKAVFDMLLSAAQPQLASILEYSYNQIIAMLNLLDRDDIDEDDVRHMFEVSHSDRDDDTMFTEQGYEADTEIAWPDSGKKEVHGKQNKGKPMHTQCFASIFRLFMELAISCKDTPSGKAIMVSVLLRFLQHLRNNPWAVQAVCSEGVLQVMLEGFRDDLIKDAQDLYELALQEILLAIFQLLTQKELSAQELSLYMRLFLSKHSPCTKDYLLSSLMNVIEHIQVEPAHTLTFPVTRKIPPKPKDSTGREKTSHLCCCPKRIWGQSAVHCLISNGLPWPPFPTGFSAALWIKIGEMSEPSQTPHNKMSKGYSSSLVFSSLNAEVDIKVDSSQKNGGTASPPIQFSVAKCVHLLSLGKSDKTFEVWVDMAMKRFIFRMTTTNDEHEILKEVCSDRVLCPSKWQHVVFSYEEVLNGSTLIGKLKLLIDGWLSREITLDYPASFHRKLLQTPPTLCVGHVIEDLYNSQVGRYQLGNVMLFKGVDFSREWWFHHFCLGPNLSSVSKCDCSHLRAVYTPFLVRDVLCQSALSIDVLVGSLPVADVDKARVSTVLIFQPKFPNSALHLDYNKLTETLAAHNLGKPIMPIDTFIYQQPQAFTPVISGKLRTQKHNTMEKAVEQIGGVRIFLFLVAKVYEECIHLMKTDQTAAHKLQSVSIQLLFAAVHHMPQLAAEFLDISGYTMLGKVMCSSRSIMGYEVLKALLNSCTSESVFRPDASVNKPVLRRGTEAVVCDVMVVKHLLLSWRIWEQAEDGVVELLFLTLKILVRADHPYQNVNIKQYKSGDILMKILSIYLERIQEGLPSLSTAVSQSVTSIIASLLGSPPDLHLLVNVTDFLLIVHPAASAYVNHNDSSLFFKSWWAFPSATSTPLKSFTHSSHSESSSSSRGDVTASKQSFKKSLSYEERSSDFSEKMSDITAPDTDEKTEALEPDKDELKESSLESSVKSNTDETHNVESDASSLCSSHLTHLQDTGSTEHHSVKDSDHSDPLKHSPRSDSQKGSGQDDYLKSSGQDDSLKGSGQGDSLKDSGQADSMKGYRNSSHSASTDNESSTDSDVFRRKQTLVSPHRLKSSHKGEVIQSSDKGEVIQSSDNGEVIQSSHKGEVIQSADNGEVIHSSHIGEIIQSSDTGEVIQSSDNLEVIKSSHKGEVIHSSNKGEVTQSSHIGEVIQSSDKGEVIQRECVLRVDLAGGGDGASKMTSEWSGVDSDCKDIHEITVEFDSTEELGSETDVGLTTLLAGFLNYIHQVILDIPDSSVEMAFSTVLDPGCMIILAHNSSPQIRAVVIRVIGAYLKRAPHHYLEKFLKRESFYLLASQLHQYQAREEHIEAAVSIFLGQHFSFDDGRELNHLAELTTLQQSSPVLLLSLIEKTSHDVALCHNSLEILCQIMETSPILTTLFLEQGLSEVLCNLIATVQREYKRPIDIAGLDESQLILMDIQTVLCILAENEFSWSGVSHYQQLEDLINLLRALEDKESTFDSEGRYVEDVRALQYAVINRVLDYVEVQSEELSQHPLSWFSMSVGSSSSLGYGNQKQSPRTFRRTFLPSQTSHAAFLTHQRSGDLFHSDKFTDVPFDDKNFSGADTDSSSDSYIKRSLSKSSSQHATTESPQSTSRLSFLFSKNKKIMHTPISQSELLDRFKKFLVFAVDLVVLRERTEVVKPVEEKSEIFFSKSSNMDDGLLTKLFIFTYRALECTLDKSSYNRKTRNMIMWGAKDLIRQQFGRLLLCMVSNRVNFNLRLYALSFIMGESKGREIIKMCASVQQLGEELSYYLFDLLTTWRHWLVGPQREQGCGLLNIMRRLGYTVFMTDQKLTTEKQNILRKDKRIIDWRYKKEKDFWQQKKETVTNRILHRFEKHTKLVAEQAMAVTRHVTQLQNVQRKKLIEHIKKNMTEQIQLKHSWQKLIQNLTHERSVWYHEDSSPCSWQLDPTEGPCRTRRRLQRSHLGLDAKYLTPDFKKNIDSESVDPPLIFLFQDDNQMSDAAALIYRLHTNEKIQYTCRCTAVSPASESKGELLVGEMSIFFVADEAITDANYTQVLLGNKDQLSMIWSHVDIRELHERRFQLQDVGLEIFLTNGKTCLLAFQSSHDRNELETLLRESLELPNLIQVHGENLSRVQRLWLDGSITNFDYLTYLNKMAGRSFNDLMQYPVFPFILSDYESVELDLNNPNIYRDLSKPIAVQNKFREKKYRDNYEFLQQEYEKDPGLDNSIRIRPYHYGSHYSNSGTVLHYLVRLPPFTKMFLSYQDRSFDIPDRTFHSVATSWRLSSFESASDVKELIPEFFFLPEFLTNSEGFDFGKRQNGEVVSDVILPPWSLSDERLFVMIHRQALESAHTTQNIHQWINLVFGYKQQGEESIKAINVFHPSTYFGIDVGIFHDQLRRQALLTMIRTYGQTPTQLFMSPHPSASVSSTSHRLMSDEKKVCIPRLRNISGLNWGNNMWNPEGLAPVVAWHHTYPVVMMSLVPLPTGYMFGLEVNACVLVLYGKDAADLHLNTTDVMWAGIVSWGYQDGILRVKNQVNRPPVNFLPETSCDEITCCASVPDCRLFFTAGSAGIISVYNVAHNRAKASHLQVFGNCTSLIGHTGPINVMVVSKAFSVLVTGSEDGTIIVWDLNRLSYVLSITSHQKGVTTLAVSDTLGDIVSVSPRALGSLLHLHTINGKLVVSRKYDEFSINCLAYSRAPEGRSINVIAGGLSTGIIRLWNSWDLSHLQDLSHEFSIARPVVSVAFTHDSLRLFSSAEDGRVTMWEKPSPRVRDHNFVAFIQPNNKQT